MGPNYPVFPSQPNAGALYPLQQSPAPDVLFSSMTAPFFQGRIDRAHGRQLAGSDVEVQDEATVTKEITLAQQAQRTQPSTAADELEYYASLDDVQGDGIFDPPGTHPNIHPDAGVFAARFSLPGYHAREKPYSLTEVADVTTGRPIRAVPNGAVSMDSAAQIAFLERGLYQPQRPLWSFANLAPIPSQSIANVVQNPQPISGMGATPDVNTKNVLVALGAGAAIGALLGFLSRKKG